jgi:xanthine dehydrogenase accessory factor
MASTKNLRSLANFPRATLKPIYSEAMWWLKQLLQLERSRTPVVCITLTEVRGHAPRDPGAKMLVTAQHTWGSVGGGNLEAVAVARAREMLEGTGLSKSITQNLTQNLTLKLTPKQMGNYGMQCCGGEVSLFLERMVPNLPQVALFGVGHVGLALAKVLATLPLEVWLVDSRLERIQEAQKELMQENQAEFHFCHRTFPNHPEELLLELRPQAQVLIFTHDHAEDIALLERALSRPDLGFIGLIGSKVKWIHFQQQLLAQGLSPTDLARVTTPIGLPQISSKLPQVIAISVAAQLLQHLELPNV